MSGPRKLVSIRRSVPAARRDAYDAAWEQVRVAVTRTGAHAWRFTAAGAPELFLEFLEFSTDADPRTLPEVSGPLNRLTHEFDRPPPVVEEWLEA